jgi:protein-tyrosine phosphatase
VRREGLGAEIEADSAGTHGFYHAGYPPDPRAVRSAARRGIDLSAQRARLLDADDCRRFDYILTMDEETYARVAALCRGGATVRPFLDYAPERPEREVPDPYYGGPDGFELAMDLAEAASEGLLREIRATLLERGPVG